jgi:hypothetical protein
MQGSNLLTEFKGGHTAKEDDVDANLKKLELLYDYTKFHIGLYLILASAYITLATSKIGRKDILPILQPALVWIAVGFFMVAGIAGGVVASGVSQSRSNSAEDFLREKIGPWSTTLFPGRVWVYVEHTAFWLGLIFAVLSFVFSK